MKITVPQLSLIVLIGASGSGKSTFARKHFLPTEIISSDFCRGLLADNENDQEVTKDAFELLHFVAAKRLELGRLVVIDATNVQSEDRRPLVELARRFHCFPVAIVLDVPERVCHERNRGRADRDLPRGVVHRQVSQLRRSSSRLKKEGFHRIHSLRSPDEIDAAELVRQPLWTDRTWESGPFDVIGDIHGCLDELLLLFDRLGYTVDASNSSRPLVRHPDGRKPVFLGDLVDRGPKTPDVLRLVMEMVGAGSALCLPGNHDVKLMRKLRGANVKVNHGMAESLAQLEQEPEEFKDEVVSFIDGLVSHYVLDGGRLVVAHAGMKREMQGRASAKVRDFALFGETTGETDEYGLPIRYNWASEYKGQAKIVYGHTTVPRAEWLNNTICIDTGCVFGGALTALRYPDLELVSVPAAQEYFPPVRPLREAADSDDARSAQQRSDDTLDIEDFIGKKTIQTRLMGKVTIGEGNAEAALEVMTRFAVDPKWLIYLPPTMSPAETSSLSDFLEHPQEAFDYFAKAGVETVVCQRKHMGSRAIVIISKDASTARQRFGITSDEAGICFTRAGRKFFPDRTLELQFLDRVRSAVTAASWWERFSTDWILLDCELMPWSAKAQALIDEQYEPVGIASQVALGAETAELRMAQDRGVDVGSLVERYTSRLDSARRYSQAYQPYVRPVNSIEDLQLAPCHVLASEDAVHVDKSHVWHMETAAELATIDPDLLLATDFRIVDLGDRPGQENAINWWRELTESGAEGIVIKPLDYVSRSKRRLVQPALKCRGREYLRIVYGPEYTAADNIDRLRARALGTKRSFALREMSLGIEALQRFVDREPLRRVHECVFGVLALESEPVDPRL